jgi:hypothetical protein
MVRRVQVRRHPGRPEGEPTLPLLPRRPVSDTSRAGRVLERIRRLLSETRPPV